MSPSLLPPGCRVGCRGNGIGVARGTLLVVCLALALATPGLAAGTPAPAPTAAAVSPSSVATADQSAGVGDQSARGIAVDHRNASGGTDDGRNASGGTDDGRDPPRIERVSYAAGTKLRDDDGTPVLVGPASVEVTFATGNESGRFVVCLADGAPPANRTQRCKHRDLPEAETATVPFDATTWNGTADRTNLTAILFVSDIERVELDRAGSTVAVLSRHGDADDDGLPNAREVEHGTDPFVRDTDRDGLDDGPEVNNYGTDPTAADTDDDGLRDAAELQQGADPLRADTDGDGLEDGREVRLGTSPVDDTTDADADGLTTEREVDLGTDPTVADTDGDLLDDGTEVRLGTNPTSATSTLALVGLALVALVAAGGVVATRTTLERRLPGLSASRPGPGAGSGDERADTGAEATGNRRGEAGIEPGADADPVADGEPTAAPEEASPAPPVRSDEDRVLAFLEENGGRVQQQEVVQRFEWSKSKVSRLLSRLEDEGKLRKIALGRENLVTLPGKEPGRSD